MCVGGPPKPMHPIRPHSRASVVSGTRSRMVGSDTAVMRHMLALLRVRARQWLGSEEPGVRVLERDAEGLRTWIRVPDRAALFEPAELTTVGFFGEARDGID